jgi:hypothetical protein
VNHLRGIAVVFAIVLLQFGTLAQEQLTEVERLRWELAAARSQLHAALAEREACRAQFVPVRGDAVKQELAQLKAAIEAAHPGWEFILETGRLTKKPETPKER